MTDEELRTAELEKFTAFFNECAGTDKKMTATEVNRAFYKKRINQIIESIPAEQANKIYSFALGFM